MPYRSLAEAGAAVGRTRSAILKAIKRGDISATRDPATGNWEIEPAELHRVFPAVSPDASRRTPVNSQVDSRETPDTADTGELRELRGRLTDKDALIAAHRDEIADLRQQRDRAQALLAAAQERIAALLTDQRTAPPAPAAPEPAPRRSWWRVRRR